MNSFLTWEYVATFTGLVFCVQMVVEFFKELPYIKSIPTRYFTAMVSFVLILFSTIFTGVFTFKDLPLAGLNAILITFTACGGHDFHYKKVKSIEDKDEDKPENK